VTDSDVETALNAQTVELPAGALESAANDYTVKVNRQYVTPDDFANLPVQSAGRTASAGGVTDVRSTYVTRLGDIARVEEGADERRRSFRANGVEQVGMGLTRQSQANDLDIAKQVRAALAEVNKTLPKGTRLVMAADYTVFTSEAIKEVWFTMALSLILVAAVNMLFLGSWRSALIPSIVAPICILGTFTVLAPLGFSLNLLTLLALVLAIGLVVDDAIVVVENIQRRIDEGEPPEVAAERGARQVFFAVVATTIVLLSVFAPLMFLPGYIGRLFVELAVAISAAIFFSALMALSLSPMLSSKMLRPASGEGWLARKMNWAMEKLRDSYRGSLEMLLSTRKWTYVAGAAVAALALVAGGLFLVLPKQLVPNEDRGRIDINIAAPEGAGYDYTLAAANKAVPVFERLRREGLLERYIMGVPRFGQNQFNAGFANLVMTDWGKRDETADEVAARLNRELQSVTGARIIASVRGPFQRGGGSGGGQNVDLIAQGNDYPEIARWLQPIVEAAEQNPGLARPRVNYEPTSPRLLINIDREKAATLGVSAEAVGRTLQVMLGSSRVTTYVKSGQEYDVILQTDLDKRRTENDLNTLYVRGASGGLIPLASVVTTEVRGDTPDRQRVDRQRAITLTAELTPGYTVADAVKFYQAETAKRANAGIVVAWGGQARDYLQASSGVGFAFAMALLLVFLVLAAQFESWIHPAIIMFTVPLAAVGGLLGLALSGSSLNTYSEIGLIILIGIAAKNGILIVEFSNQMRAAGRSVHDAVIEASALRLRPIVMTSVAASVGALPLLLAHGPGAGSRGTIGVVIFVGVLFATLLTLFVVPIFYALLAPLAGAPEAVSHKIKEFETKEAAEAGAA
ncbi:MAG: efflux RND transporter permease subunit, partial [Hyphomonadaceae bacterium]